MLKANKFVQDKHFCQGSNKIVKGCRSDIPQKSRPLHGLRITNTKTATGRLPTFGIGTVDFNETLP